jgi:GTP cyclohydrolase II
VEAVLAAFAAGGIVVVTDDDDRENEGDLFVAASLCTPEKMAFIIRHTSGIVCAPLSAEEAKRLHLDPMVAANDAPLGTAFTVSVDVRHGLTTGISIADLIAYRQVRDKLVKRIGEFPVQSKIGVLAGYAYVTPFDAIQHMAFVYGRIGDGKNMLARLHRADIIRDVFGGGNSIDTSLQRFKQEGRGVIVFLRDGAAGVPTHAIPQPGSTGSEVARSRQWREVGLGAQILKDLSITSIRLLTSAKLTYVGLAGFGIEIVSTERIDDRTPRE